jgi:hypothetical protein
MGSRHIYSTTSGSWLTVTNYCCQVFSDLMMMLVHQMHHPPSATSNNATGQNRRQQRQGEEPRKSSCAIFALSESIHFLAKAEDDPQIRRRITDLQDQARNFKRMYADSDDLNSAQAQFHRDEVQQIAEEIASLDQPLTSTPISRNGTPRTPRKHSS